MSVSNNIRLQSNVSSGHVMLMKFDIYSSLYNTTFDKPLQSKQTNIIYLPRSYPLTLIKLILIFDD